MILGCRLNIRQVSYAWQHFARGATKVMVDVDAAELAKPTLAIDLPVHADVGEVIAGLLTAAAELARRRRRTSAGWRGAASGRRAIRWCCRSTGRRRGR